MNYEQPNGSYTSYNVRKKYPHIHSSKQQNKYQKIAGYFLGLLILLGMAMFVFFIVAGVNSSTIQELRTEYNNYINMIERAEVNPDYQFTATVTGRYYDTSCNKYYVEYEIDYHYFFTPVDGVTPAMYTLEELNSKYTVGSDIEVALSDRVQNISMFTDSINMDVMQYSIEDIGNYAKVSATHDSTLTAALVCLLFAGVTLVIMIILYAKGAKIAKDSKDSDPIITEKTATAKPNTCAYCGGYTAGKQGKCPNCGAILK